MSEPTSAPTSRGWSSEPVPPARRSQTLASSDLPAGPVLIIGAHPDDIDASSAGCTIAWRARGVSVTWCVVTDGQAGGSEDSVDRAEIPAIRRREERAAAELCGVDDVVFLGWRDGEVTDSTALRRELVRTIRRCEPALVLCHTPERDWERVYQWHPDHLAVGAATLAAIYPAARNPYAYPELREAGLEPHVVAETWLYGAPYPNLFVDITAQADRKLSALGRHASQQDAGGGLVDGARRGGQARAGQAGLPDGSAAESFQRLVTG